MWTKFKKKKDSDKIWWTRDCDHVGNFYFSFDKIKVYEVYHDYPLNLTEEERRIFEEENPMWADMLGWRTK